ncbi:hypothetical protein BHE74_00052511 [Ensete ventricosum]|nr:hypothetical protein BHE74_00052511 [Ensete ventricosum]
MLIPCCSIAPMMDWTDNHYRTLARLISKHAWLYTEMVVAETIVHQSENLVKNHSFDMLPPSSSSQVSLLPSSLCGLLFFLFLPYVASYSRPDPCGSRPNYSESRSGLADLEPIHVDLGWIYKDIGWIHADQGSTGADLGPLAANLV